MTIKVLNNVLTMRWRTREIFRASRDTSHDLYPSLSFLNSLNTLNLGDDPTGTWTQYCPGGSGETNKGKSSQLNTERLDDFFEVVTLAVAAGIPSRVQLGGGAELVPMIEALDAEGRNVVEIHNYPLALRFSAAQLDLEVPEGIPRSSTLVDPEDESENPATRQMTYAEFIPAWGSGQGGARNLVDLGDGTFVAIEVHKHQSITLEHAQLINAQGIEVLTGPQGMALARPIINPDPENPE